MYLIQHTYPIIRRKVWNPSVIQLDIQAPAIARKARPGQFVILRANEESERIPLTIEDSSPDAGTISIIFQVVGASTLDLNQKREGDFIQDLAGPLGVPTHLEGLKKAIVVGGGVGCAIAYPIAKALHEKGCYVDAIIGFREKKLVILEDEFQNCSDRLFTVTDDGSHGRQGLVTDALKPLLETGEKYDRVITVGPLVMMKSVCGLTREFGIKTIASMNPIMIDGTGMCGGCRLTVNGKTRFACVDGPDFDGHQIDFDEAIKRSDMYREFERHAYKEACSLFRWLSH